MAKTATTSGRADLDMKAEAVSALAELGLTPPPAITLLYRRVVRERGIRVRRRLPVPVGQRRRG